LARLTTLRLILTLRLRRRVRLQILTTTAGKLSVRRVSIEQGWNTAVALLRRLQQLIEKRRIACTLRISLERARSGEDEQQRNKSEKPRKGSLSAARAGRTRHFNVPHDFLDKFHTRPGHPLTHPLSLSEGVVALSATII